MAITNVNHEGFQRRLDPIVFILYSYGLERPGTSVPPRSSASDTVILRLSNPPRGERGGFAASLPPAAQRKPSRVGAPCAWRPGRYPDVHDETGFGWTICEFMPGVNLDAQFSEMSLPEKLAVVEQVADILAGLQRTALPELLATGHLGGLTFDGSGQVVGGQTSILPPSPWENYVDMWLLRLRRQLHNAGQSSALKGWQEAAGVRAHIDSLINADTVGRLVQGVDATQRTLVHGDFTMNNMLFDTATKKDISGGIHIADEKLQAAVLSGRFGDLDGREAPFPDGRTTWDAAKAWDGALATRDAVRPSSIQSIRRVHKLMTLEDALYPSRLGSEVRIERLRQSPEKLAEAVKAAADRLMTLLDGIVSP
ncbi:hypothetical protein DL769_003618 [Monosporascus sp. CRB-8-3]|nr:hypothetical protein DL769_003618 [Monosporascus sp. CRB-8-3]